MTRRLLALTAVAAAATTGVATAAALWTSTSEHAYDTLAPNRTLVYWAQVGTPTDRNSTTQLIVTPDGLRHHSSGWSKIDLKPFGVPSNAKFALLTFKALFTKGAYYATVSTYAFARRPGAACCLGPPGFRDYPVDTSYNGEEIEGMVVQAAGQQPRDADRTWAANYPVPVVNGEFEFSWGYRRFEEPWPDGDAVGVAVYLGGWSR